jgi:hypothetical protein
MRDAGQFTMETLPEPPGSYRMPDGVLFDPSLQFLHPATAEALAYWTRKRGDRRCPLRQDIDPAEIPKLLRHALLFDRVPSDDPRGYSWRYRLVGTSVAALYGETTGKRLDEGLPAVVLERNRAVMEEAVARVAPMRAVGRTHQIDQLRLLAEAFVAPLSSSGSAIDMIFAVVVTWLEKEPPQAVAAAWRQALGGDPA